MLMLLKLWTDQKKIMISQIKNQTIETIETAP